MYCVSQCYTVLCEGEKFFFKLQHYRPDAVFTLHGSQYAIFCGYSHQPYPHQSPVSSQWRLPFNPRLVTVRFVPDPVALGQSFLRVPCFFFYSLSFHQYSILSFIYAFLLLEGKTSAVWDQRQWSLGNQKHWIEEYF